MHVKPVRYQNQGCLYFITFTCYRRMKLLDSAAARDAFERELERVRRWYCCFITGYVVMPEHMHLPISEPERGKLSLGIQMLKQVTSRTLKPAGDWPPSHSLSLQETGCPSLRDFRRLGIRADRSRRFGRNDARPGVTSK